MNHKMIFHNTDIDNLAAGYLVQYAHVNVLVNYRFVKTLYHKLYMATVILVETNHISYTNDGDPNDIFE